MSDYFSTTIETDLDQDGIFRHVVTAVPEMKWRRGESEAQGALTVWGHNAHGGLIQFWLYDDEVGRTTVSVSLRGVDPDDDIDDMEREALEARLLTQVFPAIGRIVERDSRASRSESRRGLVLPSGAEIVIDLFEWLPAGGEWGVSYRSADGEVHVAVEYEDGERIETKTVVFEHASYFLSQPFPGINVLDGAFSIEDVGFCEVADLGHSGFLEKCLADQHRPQIRSLPSHRHYVIYFYESGVMFNAIARGVRVE